MLLSQAKFGDSTSEHLSFCSLLLVFNVYSLCAFTGKWGTFYPSSSCGEFWLEFSFGRSPSGFWRSESQLEKPEERISVLPGRVFEVSFASKTVCIRD